MSEFRIETVDDFLVRTGMTQAKFAGLLGIHRVELRQYVNSKKNMHLVRTQGDSVQLVRSERVLASAESDKVKEASKDA